MIEGITGVIVNYRLGPKSQRPKECIVKFVLAVDGKAGRLIGRRIVWKSGKKKILGKIVAFHGSNGLVRVHFRKGVPGQALGTFVQLIG